MGRVSQPQTKKLIESNWGQALIVDYVSQTDTAAQAIASDVNFASGKRAKFDFAYFNPGSAPASTEGHLYYDDTAKKLKLRDNASWKDIPAASGGGGASHGPYTYIIYKSGSDYYAEDWEGNIVYGGSGDAGGVDGADADAVINAALANLTAGRTWYETVFLKGDFTVNASITPDNWTNLTGDARIILANSSDCHVIDINQKHHVIVSGLRIDGNEDNQTDANHFGICVRGSHHCDIIQNRVYDCTRYGIAVNSSDFTTNGVESYSCRVLYNYVYGSTWNNIIFAFCHDCLGHGNECTYCSDVGMNFWEAYDCVFSNNILYTNNKGEGYGNGNRGIALEKMCYRCSAVGNIIHDVDNAFMVQSQTGYGTDCTVQNNQIYNIAGIAISVSLNYHDVLVSDNKITTNTASGNDLIYVGSSCYRISIFDNKLLDSIRDGILMAGYNSTIKGNEIVDATDGIEVQGDDNDILDNRFFTVTTGLRITSTADETFVNDNDFRDATTDVVDSGTNTIWGDNLDQAGNFDQGVEP